MGLEEEVGPLVGKKIKHRFRVEELIGTVFAKTKEFQVRYEGEEYVCCFTLLDDIKSGDLELHLSVIFIIAIYHFFNYTTVVYC